MNHLSKLISLVKQITPNVVKTNHLKRNKISLMNQIKYHYYVFKIKIE